MLKILSCEKEQEEELFLPTEDDGRKQILNNIAKSKTKNLCQQEGSNLEIVPSIQEPIRKPVTNNFPSSCYTKDAKFMNFRSYGDKAGNFFIIDQNLLIKFILENKISNLYSFIEYI
jgi:hypothetical protein